MYSEDFKKQSHDRHLSKTNPLLLAAKLKVVPLILYVYEHRKEENIPKY
jgi:hypothetical protein